MSEKKKVANVDMHQPNIPIDIPIEWDPLPPWISIIDEVSRKRFAQLQIEFKTKELKIKQEFLKIQEERLNTLSEMIK